MLFLRIRQAECAAADGRLDEAYELASQDDVRQHRRGQRLIGRLVGDLLARGQAHLGDGRIEKALADYDKAARIGGQQTEIEKLRTAALTTLAERHREKRQHQQLLDSAHHQVDQGQISRGEQILHQLESQADAEPLA